MRSQAFVVSTLWALAASAVGAQADSAKTPATKEVKHADGEVASPRFVRLGIVYNAETQEVIANAVVKDKITGNSVLSSSTGHFALTKDFVKPGGALLEVRAPGFNPVGPFIVDPLVDTLLQVRMIRVATQLAAMVTTEKYRIDLDAGVWDGFNQRCTVAHAACFGEEELAAHPSGRMSDFLNKAEGIVPVCGKAPPTRGVGLSRSPQSKEPVSRSRRPPTCIAKMHSAVGTGLCSPTFFLNGSEWIPFEGIPQDELEVGFSPPDIKGIEVYESQRPRPLRFGGSPNCGSVVIWIK